MKTIEEDKQFVEEIGVQLESLGASPLQSRIIGLLILHTPEGLTFDEIVEFLGASKSSVSTALNFFLSSKHIVYFTKPGDRKRYFKIPFNNLWLEDFEKKVKGIDNIIDVMTKSMNYRKDDTTGFVSESRDMMELLKRVQKKALKEISQFRIEKGILSIFF